MFLIAFCIPILIIALISVYFNYASFSHSKIDANTINELKTELNQTTEAKNDEISNLQRANAKI